MGSTSRWIIAGFVAALASGGWPREASAQYGVTDSMPASAVMGGRMSDGFHSHGGVVGPWWGGSNTGAGAPAADGGFWFGFPGLGFGGSQGSTRGMNTFTPSVTSINGGTGTFSDSRLVPFVSGVVPVVGSGDFATPVTTSAMLPPPLELPSSLPPGRGAAVEPARLGPAVATTPLHPTTAGARERVKELITSGDLLLLTSSENATAAKAALAEYRSAIRFGNDNADIEIRQAMLYEAMGKRRDADKAIARAERIDGRLAGPLDVVPAAAGGFLAEPPPGLPVIAARGMAILDEMAKASTVQVSAARPGALDWLAEAWARRWGITDPAAMLVAP